MSRFLKLYESMSTGTAPTPAHPLQRPGVYIPDLTAKPWHEAQSFSWVEEVEAATPAIREEALALLDHFVPYVEPKRSGDRSAADVIPLHDRGNWDVAYFDLLGRSFDQNKGRCPETTALLSRIPRVTTSSMFSALTPGTHIAPHCGPSNAFLRVHLALVVPDGCSMRVGYEVRRWREGKCLVFDDSFEHEVWNRGKGTRIVLIFYVYHPDFSDQEIAELAALRERIPLGEEALWKRIADDLLGGRYPWARAATP